MDTQTKAPVRDVRIERHLPEDTPLVLAEMLTIQPLPGVRVLSFFQMEPPLDLNTAEAIPARCVVRLVVPDYWFRQMCQAMDAAESD